MSYPIPKETKDKILSAIKDDGLSVTEAGKPFGVAANTIYTWMGTQAKNGHTSALEFQKLKKENEVLKMIIGALSLENERVKKNQLRP